MPAAPHTHKNAALLLSQPYTKKTETHGSYAIIFTTGVLVKHKTETHGSYAFNFTTGVLVKHTVEALIYILVQLTEKCKVALIGHYRSKSLNKKLKYEPWNHVVLEMYISNENLEISSSKTEK